MDSGWKMSKYIFRSRTDQTVEHRQIFLWIVSLRLTLDLLQPDWAEGIGTSRAEGAALFDTKKWEYISVGLLKNFPCVLYTFQNYVFL